MVFSFMGQYSQDMMCDDLNCFFQFVDQEFITAEVLKLYSLTNNQSQKTDWQKMLKFGRKKRDRVDHILVGPKSNAFTFLHDFRAQQFKMWD